MEMRLRINRIVAEEERARGFELNDFRTMNIRARNKCRGRFDAMRLAIIRRAQAELGVSQSELGRAFGIDQAQMSKILRRAKDRELRAAAAVR